MSSYLVSTPDDTAAEDIQSDPADHVGRSVIVRSAKDELTRRYGPRP